MIKYNYEVSVNENRAKLNKDIFLFRGNRNIHYYFSIKGARFTFSKENEDLLESSNAIYAAVTVVKPNGVEVANAIAPVEDGLIHLKVTEDLIDEEVEVGDFDLVFDLFDDNEGAVTIPKIKGQFHVQERPCTTSIGILSGNVNVVNQAVVDLAIATQENEQLIVVDDDGKYVKTTWAKGDKISVERLNKMEEGIYNNSSRLKNIGTGGSTNASDITITDVNDNFESANVEGALNELGTQYKDIANYSLEKSSDDGKLYLKKGTEYVGTGIEIVSITDEQISTILKGFIADGTLGGAGTINPPIDDPVIVPDTTPQVEGHSVYEYLNLDDVKEINYNFDINTIKCIMCLPVGGSFETKLCFNENSNMYLRNYKHDALQVSQWVGFSTQYPDVSMISNTDQASELNGYIWNDGNIIFIDSSQNIIKKSMSMNSWFADTTIINKINLTAGEKSVFLIYDKALTDEEILKLYNQYKSI